MSRIFKCNRCNNTFVNKGKYSILRQANGSVTPIVTTAWIDLCPTCTTAFETFLHPNQLSGNGVNANE